MKKAGIDIEDVRNLIITFFLFVFFLLLFAVSYSFVSGKSLSSSVSDAFARIFGVEQGEPLTAFSFLFISAILVWFVIDYFMKILLRIELGGVRRMVKMSGMKNHYIVCGYGRVGSHVVSRLQDIGEKVVVIEKDKEKVNGCKFAYIVDDSLEEDVLKRAGIEKAEGIVCCLGESASNIFLVITAKHMNSELKVGSRADNQRTAAKLRHAGADIIVLPEAVGGSELADKMAEK
jgi:voltage-gated potassium channel